MPLQIRKIGGKWVMTDPSGKVFGRHTSRSAAIKQITAIELNKARRGK